MQATQYLLDTTNRSVIERIWEYCQNSGQEIPMYRSRVGFGRVAWVVEPTERQATLFLIAFGQWAVSIRQ